MKLKWSVLICILISMIFIGFSNVSAKKSKTFGDYYREAYKRLINHPESAYFKIDPKLYGEWNTLESKIGKTYSVVVKYFNFNSDGTMHFESVPYYLRKNGVLSPENNEAQSLDFYWGITTYQNEKGEPIVTLKVVPFDETQEEGYFFYGCFEDNTVGLVYYDQHTEKTDKMFLLYNHTTFVNDWNKNVDSLAKSLYKLYKAKKQYNEALLYQYMGWNTAWMGLMGASGAWFAAPATY